MSAPTSFSTDAIGSGGPPHGMLVIGGEDYGRQMPARSDSLGGSQGYEDRRQKGKIPHLGEQLCKYPWESLRPSQVQDRKATVATLERQLRRNLTGLSTMPLTAEANLYIAEAKNHCIRKLNLQTGIITTIAGCGRMGFSGDGGPAKRATMNEPYALQVDTNGDIYIVDRLNAVVRKVDARTGTIITVVGNGTKGYGGDGGLAVHAQMREPNDCFLDGRGGLLIADIQDQRVRRLDLRTGIITTFAEPAKSYMEVMAGLLPKPASTAVEPSVWTARVIPISASGKAIAYARLPQRALSVLSPVQGSGAIQATADLRSGQPSTAPRPSDVTGKTMCMWSTLKTMLYEGLTRMGMLAL